MSVVSQSTKHERWMKHISRSCRFLFYLASLWLAFSQSCLLTPHLWRNKWKVSRLEQGKCLKGLPECLFMQKMWLFKWDSVCEDSSDSSSVDEIAHGNGLESLTHSAASRLLCPEQDCKFHTAVDFTHQWIDGVLDSRCHWFFNGQHCVQRDKFYNKKDMRLKLQMQTKMTSAWQN